MPREEARSSIGCCSAPSDRWGNARRGAHAQPRTPVAPHDLEGFSLDEQRWIDEVWPLQEIQLMFGANPSLAAGHSPNASP